MVDIDLIGDDNSHQATESSFFSPMLESLVHCTYSPCYIVSEKSRQSIIELFGELSEKQQISIFLEKLTNSGKTGVEIIRLLHQESREEDLRQILFVHLTCLANVDAQRYVIKILFTSQDYSRYLVATTTFRAIAQNPRLLEYINRVSSEEIFEFSKKTIHQNPDYQWLFSNSFFPKGSFQGVYSHILGTFDELFQKNNKEILTNPLLTANLSNTSEWKPEFVISFYIAFRKYFSDGILKLNLNGNQHNSNSKAQNFFKPLIKIWRKFVSHHLRDEQKNEIIILNLKDKLGSLCRQKQTRLEKWWKNLEKDRSKNQKKINVWKFASTLQLLSILVFILTFVYWLVKEKHLEAFFRDAPPVLKSVISKCWLVITTIANVIYDLGVFVAPFLGKTIHWILLIVFWPFHWAIDAPSVLSFWLRLLLIGPLYYGVVYLSIKTSWETLIKIGLLISYPLITLVDFVSRGLVIISDFFSDILGIAKSEIFVNVFLTLVVIGTSVFLYLLRDNLVFPILYLVGSGLILVIFQTSGGLVTITRQNPLVNFIYPTKGDEAWDPFSFEGDDYEEEEDFF